MGLLIYASVFTAIFLTFAVSAFGSMSLKTPFFTLACILSLSISSESVKVLS